jgi:hypothetical protein
VVRWDSNGEKFIIGTNNSVIKVRIMLEQMNIPTHKTSEIWHSYDSEDVSFHLLSCHVIWALGHNQHLEAVSFSSLLIVNLFGSGFSAVLIILHWMWAWLSVMNWNESERRWSRPILRHYPAFSLRVGHQHCKTTWHQNPGDSWPLKELSLNFSPNNNINS